jgi:hypothetical protein
MNTRAEIEIDVLLSVLFAVPPNMGFVSLLIGIVESRRTWGILWASNNRLVGAWPTYWPIGIALFFMPGTRPTDGSLSIRFAVARHQLSPRRRRV